MTSQNSQTSESSFPLDIELQYHILKMMMQSEPFLVKCAFYVKEEYFANYILGWFFRAFTEYYTTYKQLMSELTLRNELLKFSPEERPKYEIVFEKIIASNYTNEGYLRKELTGWLRSRKFIKLHKDMELLYNQNKRDSAYDVTSTAIQDLKQIDFEEESRVRFGDLDSLLDEGIDINRHRISTGIHEIDRAMMGGLARQTVTTVLGDTNVGKTIFCINLIYHAIMRGHRVLSIYHEGQDCQMKMRLLSRFTGIPFSDFYRGREQFTPDDRAKVEAAEVLLEEYLYLRPWQQCGLTVDQVVAFARQAKAEFDFDLLIDDYAQLLRVRTPDREVRHNQSEVWRDLSALSAELKIAVVTPAQGNRAAAKDIMEGKRLLGITDIAECYDIARTSECVITLTRSIDDEVNNRLKVLLAKQREGVRNVAVECRTDYSKLIAYDPKLGIRSLRLAEGLELIDDSNMENQTLDSNVSVGGVSPTTKP